MDPRHVKSGADAGQGVLKNDLPGSARRRKRLSVLQSKPFAEPPFWLSVPDEPLPSQRSDAQPISFGNASPGSREGPRRNPFLWLAWCFAAGLSGVAVVIAILATNHSRSDPRPPLKINQPQSAAKAPQALPTLPEATANGEPTPTRAPNKLIDDLRGAAKQPGSVEQVPAAERRPGKALVRLKQRRVR